MRADHLLVITPSLDSELRRWGNEQADRASLVDVVSAVAGAAARLAAVVAINPLKTALAADPPESWALGGPRPAAVPLPTGAPGTNPSGDEQKPLDLYAEAAFVTALAGLDVAAICSEESPEPIPVTRDGRFVVALDPVDGSSNIDANGSLGTIFAVLPVVGPGSDPTAALLQPGRRQVAAGMVVYGPATVLALTVGDGTDLYVLDPRSRDFRLLRRGARMPEEAPEYAVNASNARHWGPGIRAYIGDLVSGALGPRERDFNMRWLASLVGEAYRILVRGGIFLYPGDARPGYRDGRIRLVYEANPIAFLCEQAGGAATDGTDPILDRTPEQLHQRVPLVFGSRSKVERVRRYLLLPHPPHETQPLFATRGLFRS